MSEFETLLPPNASKLVRSLEIAMAEPVLDLQAPIEDLWNVDRCPPEILPFLAWGLSVEQWPDRWSDEVRRKVVRSSIELHRIKGTPRALRLALQDIGFRINLAEWWEYGGEPHTFRLDAFGDDVFDSGFDIDHELADIIRARIRNVKPVRSHFSIRIGQTLRHSLAAAVSISAARRCVETFTPQPNARTIDGALVMRPEVRPMQRARLDASLSPNARASDVPWVSRGATRARQRIVSSAILNIPPEAIYAT